VRFHAGWRQTSPAPDVGELDLTYDATALTADAGLTVVTCSAEPSSRSQEGLSLLASWIAATEHAQR
jgi:hypothetical protein